MLSFISRSVWVYVYEFIRKRSKRTPALAGVLIVCVTALHSAGLLNYFQGCNAAAFQLCRLIIIFMNLVPRSCIRVYRPPSFSSKFFLYVHCKCMCSTVEQWYSTWGTRVICDTLTKKFWHFAFIFTWHFWRKDVKKMTPWQTQR